MATAKTPANINGFRNDMSACFQGFRGGNLYPLSQLGCKIFSNFCFNIRIYRRNEFTEY